MKQPSKATNKRPTSIQPQTSSFQTLFGSGALAFCIFVAILAIFYGYTLRKDDAAALRSPSAPAGSKIPDQDRYSLRHYNIVGNVPIIYWEPKKPFSKEVISLNQPVVLRNTFVSLWPALKRWSPSVLSQRTGDKIYDFKQLQDDNIFIYSQQKPLDQLPELDFRQPFNLTYKTLKQFWSHSKSMENFTNTQLAESRRGKTWLYFTGCLERSEDQLREFPSLLAELPNLKGFVANNDYYAIHLWLGTRGVTAQTHYDQAPNFATQIYGHKRWILSPPSEAPKMYGYPWLHPFRSQSQVDFTSDSIRSVEYRSRKGGLEQEKSNENFPLFGNISALEALLEPGDVLYIPSLWYHRVITEDTSIMVNAWTDPPEGDPHVRLSSLPVPLEENWTLEQKALGLKLFFKAVADKLPNRPTFPGAHPDAEWTFEILKQQYKSLFSNNQVPPFDEHGKSKKITCKVDDDLFGEVQKKLESKDYVTEVVRTLESYEDVHAQRLQFAAYIEKVAHFVLSVDYVYGFIMCL